MSFAPELAIDVMSLSAMAVSSWTSNPVGGVRFEILFMSTRDFGVAGLGAVFTFSASSGAVGVAPVPAGGESSTPSNAWDGQGEGRLVLVEGDQSDELTVGRDRCGSTLRVFTHILVSLGAVLALFLLRGKGFRWVLLQQFSDGQLPLQGLPARRHSQWSFRTHFTVGKLLQHF